MATSPLASAGIGSGLDVNAIVDKLMSIERRPLDALAKQQATFQAKISAYGALQGVLSSLKASIAAFANGTALKSMTAKLSDPAVASAAVGSGAVAGNYGVEVTQLAQAQRIASSGFATNADAVGGGTLTFAFGTFAAGTFTVNAEAPAKTVTIGAGATLAGIRDAVNAARIGVSASIVDDGTAAGQRLVFTSSSGANMSLKVTVTDGDGTNTDNAGLSRLAYDPAAAAGSGRNMTETTAARNAALNVDGIAITSATNVVSDAIAGVTLTLTKTNAGSPATLTVARDTAGTVAAMEAFITAYNNVQKTIATLTKYDPAKQAGSVLTGDSAVRTIQSQLRTLVTGTIASGVSGGTDPSSLAEVGVKSAADGTLSLDGAKFSAMLASNAAAVERLFVSAGVASDPLVAYLGAGTSTQPGNHAVNVTQLAARGTLVGSSTANRHIQAGNNDTLTATIDGTTVTVTLTAHNYGTVAALAAEVQSKLNAASGLVAAGSSVTVTDSGNVITITSNRYGNASTVSLSGNGASSLMGNAPTATAGKDVAGTIGGHAATGSGNVLTGAVGTPVEGLKLAINGGTTGARGMLRYSLGLGTRLDEMLEAFVDGDGLVASRTEGVQASIKALDKRKEALESRLERVEDAYRRQYTALDTTISRMSAISTYLAQQLANLPKPYDDGER